MPSDYHLFHGSGIFALLVQQNQNICVLHIPITDSQAVDRHNYDGNVGESFLLRWRVFGLRACLRPEDTAVGEGADRSFRDYRGDFAGDLFCRGF